MSYQVIYDEEKKKRKEGRERRYLLPFTVVVWTIFLLLVNAYWPEGQEALRRFLIPGDSAITVAALDTLAQDIMDGESLWRAVETFAHEVGQRVSWIAN